MTLTARPANGMPFACSVPFIRMPGTLATLPPTRSGGRTKVNSATWLAGRERSLLRRNDIVILSFRSGISTSARTTRTPSACSARQTTVPAYDRPFGSAGSSSYSTARCAVCGTFDGSNLSTKLFGGFTAFGSSDRSGGVSGATVSGGPFGMPDFGEGRRRHRVLRQRAPDADARHEIRQGRAGACRDCKHLGLQYCERARRTDRRSHRRQLVRSERHPLCCRHHTLDRAPLHPVAGVPQLGLVERARHRSENAR